MRYTEVGDGRGRVQEEREGDGGLRGGLPGEHPGPSAAVQCEAWLLASTGAR